MIKEKAMNIKSGDHVVMVTERIVKVKKGYTLSPITKRSEYDFIYNDESYFQKIMSRYGTHQESTRESFYQLVSGILFKSVKDEEKLYVNFSYDKRKVNIEVSYIRDGKTFDPFTADDETAGMLLSSEWPGKKGASLVQTSSGKTVDEPDIRYQANKLENIIQLDVIV